MINLVTNNGYKFPINSDNFPDGTLHLKMDFDFKEDLNDPITAIEWLYDNDAELFTLICAKRWFEMRNIKLYLPYVPHARMDRIENRTDVFTLKYFCEVINSLNFSHVCVRDVHSPVTLALLDRVIETDITYLINRAINAWTLNNQILTPDEIAIFFPDNGAMKRYNNLQFSETARTCGFKTRDWSTGKITGLEVMNPELIKDKYIFIIDDICSYGGTFYHSAEALHRLGAKKIALYVTHCESSIFSGKLIEQGLITDVYTTESIMTDAKNQNPDFLHIIHGD